MPDDTAGSHVDDERLARLQKRVNLLPCLYQSHSREESVEVLAGRVQRTKNPVDIKRLEYLRWYLSVTTHECREEARRVMYAAIAYLNMIYMSIVGVCSLRQKALVSFDTKVIRKQERAYELGQDPTMVKCPLDVQAMRIILDGNEIATTYIVAECLMDYFTQNGNEIADSPGTVKSGEFIPEKYPDAVLPTEEMRAALIRKYPGKFKDYNADPKANGYQALHFVVWVYFFVDGVKVKFPLEIQIYTQVAFDRVNEQSSAVEINEDTKLENHEAYKNRMEGYLYAWRGNVSVLDLVANGFEGIEYNFDTGEYIDHIGIVHPIRYSIPTSQP